MISYEMGDYKKTMALIYEIDELALDVLVESDCKEASKMTALKLLKKEKEEMVVNGTKIYFVTQNNVTVDVSLVPYLIAKY